jgi:NADH-quinone oxidoreductase subunit N
MKSLMVVFVGAIVVMFAGLGKKESKSLPLALLFLIAALVLIPLDFMAKLPWKFELKYVDFDMLFFDRVALAFSGLLILASIFILSLFKSDENYGSDLPVLFMFSLCGALIMTAANNLAMLFLGIEALSIPLYVLVGSRKKSLAGNEAAIKYFLMGAFSTAVFLLGCAFIYGSTGAIDLESIFRNSNMLAHMKANNSLQSVGISLLLVGLCFKVSAFPFHFWSPDVYEGSPNRATVFMSTIVKVAAFAAFFRLFTLVLMDAKELQWGVILAVISGMTILVGNIAAIRQSNVKRTLAYSSVAHAGYMLMAILSNPEDAFWALLLYGAGYVAANVIVFYYFNALSSEGNESFDVFNGMASKDRFGAVLIAISMFSLAGIPLTVGFAGKYSIFTAAFQGYPWLVGVALLGSAISIAYYFRVLKSVFFTEGDSNPNTPAIDKFVLLIAAACIIVLGVAPAILTQLSQIKY